MDLMLVRYLGELCREMPSHTDKEWSDIFKFLDYFFVLQNNKHDSIMDWKKVKEILILMDKVSK